MTTEEDGATAAPAPRDKDIAQETSKLLSEMDFRRGRLFHIMLASLKAAILLWIIIDGDRSTVAYFTMSAIAIGSASGFGSTLLIRSAADIKFSSAGPLIVPIYISSAFATYYLGFFSGIALAMGVAIYVFGSSHSRVLARTTYAISAAILGGGMVAIALGLLPNKGRMAPLVADANTLLTVAAVTQIALLGVYLLARQTAGALARSVEGMVRAMHEVDRREALFGEARAELERVLHVHAGTATGTVVGTWRLGVVLGRGGMGDVYEGKNVASGERAAVKLLPADMRDPELIERFHRETAALARLDHPNVVRLIDFGEGYLAMELLEGKDLAAILRQRRALSVAEVVELVRQVASALEAARKADIVHRDLKPQNIFCVGAPESRPTWKVLDFGIARLGRGNATLTRGSVIGTPAYMAPEQLRGDTVDHRADVFGLALVAYRALTGRPAFAADDNAKLALDVLHRQPEAASVIAGLDADFDHALALGLAKDRSDRYATALELADAIEHAAEKRLPKLLRERASALLTRHPWGAFTSPPSEARR